METTITTLLWICFIGLLMCLYTLHKQGEALDWFSQHENKRKFRKHFGSENITVFINDVGSVSLHLSVKGKSKELELGYRTALDLYKITQGKGIRKYLHEKGCI
ncbi:hypothetical protein [Salmonella phage SSBI34]|nr:hypothetical protein [Salmonella phage SSBI34]